MSLLYARTYSQVHTPQGLYPILGLTELLGGLAQVLDRGEASTPEAYVFTCPLLVLFFTLSFLLPVCGLLTLPLQQVLQSLLLERTPL